MNQDICRVALITTVAEQVSDAGLGRTAVMKLCYFLQSLKQVPLGYHFKLYTYGPFDAEVLSDLATAEALNAISTTVVLYPGGYGYKISPGRKFKKGNRTGQSLYSTLP